MQTVLSIFLFLLAIAYVEYRLKSLRREDSDDKSSAFDFFATKEELKKAVKKIGGPKVKELKAHLSHNVSAVKAVGHHHFRVRVLPHDFFF